MRGEFLCPLFKSHYQDQKQAHGQGDAGGSPFVE